MIYFSNMRLTMAKNKCSENLERIAELLGNKRSQFRDAVTDSDGEKLDNFVGEAIQTFTGEQNPIYGLRRYCEKFGLALDHPASSEWDYLRLISDNREKISQILKDNGF